MLSGINLLTASLKSFVLHLPCHDFHHLLGLADLLVLSIKSLLYLIVAFFRKTSTEQTKQISISRLDINMSFSHGLPFFDHGTFCHG